MSSFRALLLLVLLTPGLVAQISEKDAVRRLDDAIDAAEELFEDAAKQAVKDVNVAVKVAQAGLKSEAGFTDALMDGVVDAVAAAQLRLRDGYEEATFTIASGAFDALSDHLDGESFAGNMPKAFVERQGGRLGKAKAELRKEAAKAARRIASRMKRLVKPLEKAGVTLSYVIAPVGPRSDNTHVGTGVATYVGESESSATLDHVVAWRVLEDPFGELRAGGTGTSATRFVFGASVPGVGGGWGTIEPDLDEETERWRYDGLFSPVNVLMKVISDDNFTFDDDEHTIAFGLR